MIDDAADERDWERRVRKQIADATSEEERKEHVDRLVRGYCYFDPKRDVVLTAVDFVPISKVAEDMIAGLRVEIAKLNLDKPKDKEGRP